MEEDSKVDWLPGPKIEEVPKKNTSLGDVIGGILLVVGLYSMIHGCFSTNDYDTKGEEKPEVTKQNTSHPDWHRAESKAEVARRIKDRLVGELATLGLDASNIVANAKAHPNRKWG